MLTCPIKLVYWVNKFIFLSYHNMYTNRTHVRLLKKYHQDLRSGLLVDNFLPALRPLLTDVEYLRVDGREDNVAKVDKLVEILLTKEDRHFERFCVVLEQNGYKDWAMRLREDAYEEEEGMLVCLHVL